MQSYLLSYKSTATESCVLLLNALLHLRRLATHHATCTTCVNSYHTVTKFPPLSQQPTPLHALAQAHIRAAAKQ
jgi:hypothetical protein